MIQLCACINDTVCEGGFLHILQKLLSCEFETDKGIAGKIAFLFHKITLPQPHFQQRNDLFYKMK